MRLVWLFLLIVILMIVGVNSKAAITYHWMRPSGSDSNTGADSSNAFATLPGFRAHISNNHAGNFADQTIYIMGGVYSNNQNFTGTSQTGGTAGHPLTFKAYGDRVATFTNGGFHYTGSYDIGYITIDGFSSLNPDSARYLKFAPTSSNPPISFQTCGEFNSSAALNCQYHIRNLIVRGIEIDGSGSPTMITAFNLTNCDSFLVDRIYAHYLRRPTGNIPPGDGSNQEQGSGDMLMIASCEFGKITNSVIKYSNHGLIDVIRVNAGGSESHTSRYITVKNNILENHWGGGIYFNNGTEYSLADGNLILHVGETTTYIKEGIQCSGTNNTIRRNVFHNPHNNSIDIIGCPMVSGRIENSDSNYIYNNTVFGSGKRHNARLMTQSTGTARNNVFANNIFYLPYDTLSVSHSPHDLTNLWINMSPASCWGSNPLGGTWGDNVFRNNLMRVDATGCSYYSGTFYECAGNNTHDYSVAQLNGDGSGKWTGNVCYDPVLKSERPDTVVSGACRWGNWDWYKLRYNSPCIDSGAVIDDPNGAYVRGINANWGWHNLPYYGSAPDIGAYEYRTESGAPPSPPRLDCRPGLR